MSRLIVLMVALVGSFVANSVAQAAIVLSVQPSVVFVPPPGIRSFDIFARSTTPDPATEPVIGLTADLQIPGAVLSARNPLDIPNYHYGRLGQIGNPAGTSNINPASSYTIDNVNKIVSLSLDFSAQQIFPGVNTPLFTIDVDTTTMAPGTYNVNFLDTVANGPVLQIQSSGQNGSFEVSAIPEPSSVLLLGGSILAAGFARRRRAMAA